MKTNPILEEVWRIKDQLAAESGYDVNRFFEQLRAWSAAHPHSGRVVHSAEELRQLVAQNERQRAAVSPMKLNDQPPGGGIKRQFDSFEHAVFIIGAESVRKELQERFSKVGLPSQDCALETLSVEPYLAMPMLWVTYTMIRQLTPILFEFKRSKTNISIKLVIGEKQGNRREISVQNELEFEQAAQEGLNEIHITD
jgi:hypothetical protein